MKEEWTVSREWFNTLSRIKKAPIAQVCDWTLRLWNGVQEEVAVKSFEKCGISDAVDGTGADEIYQDEESDSSEDTSHVEIEEDDTSDIDSEGEFLAFYDL